VNLPVVTAIGRRLKPKNGEPRKYQLIQIDENGRAKIIKDQLT